MKQRVLTFVLAVLLLVLTACGAKQKEPYVGKDETVARFKIIELWENGFLGVMLTEREDLYSVSFGDTVCYDEEGKIFAAADLRPGMVVDIYWDGVVLETWPGRIGGVSALQVAEQQDDLVGLYREVLQVLWDTDPALNHDAVQLGLDFSKLTNLTRGEVRALEYLFSCDVGLFAGVISGTWQELCDAGFINEEELYWENGVFLLLEVTAVGDRTFTFNAQKWRSGTGAIWFNGCKAKPEKRGQWTWEAGVMAIS